MFFTKRLAPTIQHVVSIIGMAAIFLLGTGNPCLASDSGIIKEPPPEPVIGAIGISSSPSTLISVTINRQDDNYRLYHDGQPYFIKGIGGRQHLGMAAAAGANSIRTWGSHDAGDLLDRARSYEMTVMLGTWLSHEQEDYLDPTYKSVKINELQKLLDDHKNHPALLMWALGNEINLEGADTPAAWGFVNELALLIKSQDPHHPVISVIACKPKTLNNIAAYAPDLDVVGINAYGTLSDVRTMIDNTAFEGPYIVTEWGVDGHWEAEKTVWGRPIEPTSAQKARNHLQHYEQNILANRDRCIGSYVFLWGQKQERTPTWYSMFIENLPGTDLSDASCPTVDVMHFNWSGDWPSNQAPRVDEMTINGVAAADDVKLTPGEPFVAQVAAADPDNDGLRFVWELMEEPTVLGIGGSYEPRPGGFGNVMDGSLPNLNLLAPERSGEYRLFVYVLDENGHVGTANIPFQVDGPITQNVAVRPSPPSDS